MTLESFSRRITIRAGNLPKAVNQIVRKSALAIDQTIVMATPVDKGRARSNWIVSLGLPVLTEIEPYAPGSKLGIGEAANAAAAIEQAKSTLNNRQPEQTIYITNNLDYIEKLNRGSSAQAPAMFVEQAIDAGLQAIVGARLNTGRSGGN